MAELVRVLIADDVDSCLTTSSMLTSPDRDSNRRSTRNSQSKTSPSGTKGPVPTNNPYYVFGTRRPSTVAAMSLQLSFIRSVWSGELGMR